MFGFIRKAVQYEVIYLAQLNRFIKKNTEQRNKFQIYVKDVPNFSWVRGKYICGLDEGGGGKC